MSDWGPLTSRYATNRPRKILALDGGGIRGVITLQILAEMEKQLREATGQGENFRLCDYFDYIGGTSTGAIIAAGLALGMSVDELLRFYLQEGSAMFDKAFLLHRWKSLYESGSLLEKLKSTFGETTTINLSEGKLKCLLLVVVMNRSTDSPWPVNNVPCAKYNDIKRADCNLHIPLYQLVRASTAAPVYFPPETLQWDPDNPRKSFVFVDGGVTPYNNPAFLLYRLATQQSYGLHWETGENNLMVVSVGTGAAPTEGAYENLLNTAVALPNNLLYAVQVDQDINCRTVGRCSYAAPIDRELGDMIPRKLITKEGCKIMDSERIPLENDLGRHFLYIRYNADLSQQGIDAMGVYHVNAAHVRQMDSVKYLHELQEVGAAAARQVSLKHFGVFAPEPHKSNPASEATI